MTPLAQQIIRDSIGKGFDGRRDCAGVRNMMDDVHCFEVTAAISISDAIASKIDYRNNILAFLPADKTWIEFTGTAAGEFARMGFLLVRDGDAADVYWVKGWRDGFWKSVGRFIIPLYSDARPTKSGIALGPIIPDDGANDLGDSAGPQFSLLSILAIINSPRVIGRRQHMPHRGLERQLLKAGRISGRFPLHAWTEIKLEINARQDASIENSSEAHLTGQRALHFCRAHLRFRLGRVEIVNGHWRGDGSLGIRRSRYQLTPPRNQAESLRA